jgi:putative ABC transport system permease protein
VKSLGRVASVPLGFSPGDLLFVQVTLPEAKYPGIAARRVFFDALLERVNAIPGVRSSSLVEYPPLAGAPHTKLTIVGRAPVPVDQKPLVLRALTAPGYFKTLGARLVAGRDFDAAAAPDAPLTAVVNRSLARTFFPGESPIGKRVKLRGGTSEAEIVGVVDDVKQQALEQGIEPMIFLSLRQVGPDLFPPNYMNLAVRTERPLEDVAAALRREVRALDPGQPLPEIKTMGALLSTATARRRLTTGLFSGFSALALALALLGIYGVAAHAVSLRRREIAVRMAVGASRAHVLREVLARGSRWIAPGLVVGAFGGWAAGRALAGQLFEVNGADVLNIARSAGVLGVVALLACLLPARRASRIDPAVALRTP